MERVSYRIQSKIINQDGKSDFVKFGTSNDIDYTIKYHLYHLRHRTHPDPQLMNYTQRHGIDSLEFIIDSTIFIVETPIEKAILIPEKETRNNVKRRMADNSV